MFNVICTLPNASDNISGVAFEPHEPTGVITVSPVDATVAARFARIPGYEVVDLDAKPVTEGVSLGRGRVAKSDIEAWTAEIEKLGGSVPEGAKAKEIFALLTSLREKAAEAPNAAPAEEPEAPAPDAAASQDGEQAAEVEQPEAVAEVVADATESTTANGESGGETQE